MSVATKDRKENLTQERTSLDNIKLSNFSIETEDSLVPRNAITTPLEKMDLLSNLDSEQKTQLETENQAATLKKILTGCATCNNKGVGCDTCGIKQLAQEKNVTAALDEIVKIQKKAVEEGRLPFNPAEGTLEVLPTKVELVTPAVEQNPKLETEQPLEVKIPVTPEISKESLPETKPEVKDILSGCASCTNKGVGCDTCGIKQLAQEKNITAALEEIAEIQKQAAQEGRLPFDPSEGTLEILPAKVELVISDSSETPLETNKATPKDLVDDELTVKTELKIETEQIELNSKEPEQKNDLINTKDEIKEQESTLSELATEKPEPNVTREDLNLKVIKTESDPDSKNILEKDEGLDSIPENQQRQDELNTKIELKEEKDLELERKLKDQILPKEATYLKDDPSGDLKALNQKEDVITDPTLKTPEINPKKLTSDKVVETEEVVAELKEHPKDLITESEERLTDHEENPVIEAKINQDEDVEITDTATNTTEMVEDNLKSDEVVEADEMLAEFNKEDPRDLITEDEDQVTADHKDSPEINNQVEEEQEELKENNLNYLGSDELQQGDDSLELDSPDYVETNNDLERNYEAEENQGEIIGSDSLLEEEADFETELNSKTSEINEELVLIDNQEQDLDQRDSQLELNSTDLESEILIEISEEEKSLSLTDDQLESIETTIELNTLQDNIEIEIKSPDLIVFNDETLTLLMKETEEDQIILANLIDIGTSLEVNNKQILSLLRTLSKEKELVLVETVPSLDQKLDGLLSKKNYLLNSKEFKKVLCQKIPNLETEELLSFLFMLQTLKKSKSKLSELTLEEQYLLEQMLSGLGENTCLGDLTEEEITELIIELKEFILNSTKLGIETLESENQERYYT